MKTSRLLVYATLTLAAALSLNSARAGYVEKALYTFMGPQTAAIRPDC